MSALQKIRYETEIVFFFEIAYLSPTGIIHMYSSLIFQLRLVKTQMVFFGPWVNPSTGLGVPRNGVKRKTIKNQPNIRNGI